MVGEEVVGEAVVGDPVVGEAVVGQAVVGDSVVGEAVVGEPYPPSPHPKAQSNCQYALSSWETWYLSMVLFVRTWPRGSSCILRKCKVYHTHYMCKGLRSAQPYP